MRAWIVFGPRLITEAVLAWVRRRAIHTPIERRAAAKRWGLKWHLDLGDNLQRRLYFARSYEAATLFHVARRMRADDIIVDVGANIGTFVLPLLRHVAVAGRGYALEPAEDTALQLRRNIRVNRLDDRVHAVNVALADRDGVATLRKGRNGGDDKGLRSLVGSGDGIGTIAIRRGDGLLRELGLARVDVLKIDVEGGEHAVLSGFEDQFRNDPPRLLIVELVEPRARSAQMSVPELVRLLERVGYRGWWIRYRGLQELARASGRSGNALFLRAKSVVTRGVNGASS